MKELVDEAKDILTNMYRAMMREEITQDNYIELRNAVLLDIAYQAEILTEGNNG